MGKFDKKSNKDSPGISTASLPDIVFMLLFFFMVSTTMKEVDYKVAVQLPQATEIKKLENKSLVSYIYVGPPKEKWQKQFGTTPVIQLNDAISTISNIQQYVEQERADRSEADAKKLTYSLKVHEETQMGIVSDIKQKMREVQALKINYSCKRKY